MSPFLILVVMFIYLCVSAEYLINGEVWWALVWFSYALANVGFIALAHNAIH